MVITRINVIPVEELTDQHLLAEARELPRIPNAILKGRYTLSNVPDHYVLGTGHVKFWYPRLGWLRKRYNALYDECLSRSFNVEYRFPDGLPESLMGEYTVTNEALETNRQRIITRRPKNARYCGELL